MHKPFIYWIWWILTYLRSWECWVHNDWWNVREKEKKRWVISDIDILIGIVVFWREFFGNSLLYFTLSGSQFLWFHWYIIVVVYVGIVVSGVGIHSNPLENYTVYMLDVESFVCLLLHISNLKMKSWLIGCWCNFYLYENNDISENNLSVRVS